MDSLATVQSHLFSICTKCLRSTYCDCSTRSHFPYSERTVSARRLVLASGHLAGAAEVLRD